MIRKYTEIFTKKKVLEMSRFIKNPYRTALAYTMDDLVQTWDYEDYNPFYVQMIWQRVSFDVDELFHMVKTAKPQLNDCKITSDNGDGEYVFEIHPPDQITWYLRSDQQNKAVVYSF